MTEQNKLEAPNTNPNHSIDIPADSCSADSTGAPLTQGSKVDDVGEEKRLGFLGFGLGWDLFILGFFLLAIPWFVGALMFLIMICVNENMRDKYGYLACFIGAVVVAIFLDTIERARGGFFLEPYEKIL